jgi:hypothetical protein
MVGAARAFVVMVAVTVALRRLVVRRTAWWRKGLSVLGDGAACTRMAAFVALAVCAQVVRNWLMLQASGIHASAFDATAVLIAVAVLGVLPVGPSVGAAAAVLILGAQGVAGVSAAGVMLTATGTAGALAYCAWAYADRRWGEPSRAPARDRHKRVLVGAGSAEANAP